MFTCPRQCVSVYKSSRTLSFLGSLRSDQAKQASESKPNQESAEVSEEDSQGTDDLDRIAKDLHRNNDLPTDAKTMLADLQLDQSGISSQSSLSDNLSFCVKLKFSFHVYVVHLHEDAFFIHG